MKIDGSGEAASTYSTLVARGTPQPATTSPEEAAPVVPAVRSHARGASGTPRARVDTHVADPSGAQTAAVVERSASYIESLTQMLDEGGVVFPRSTIDRSLTYLALSVTLPSSGTTPRTISLDGGVASKARFNVLA